MNEIVDMVFKRIEGVDQTLDTRAFNVLAAIDGVRSVGAIARDNQYDISDLSSVVDELRKKGVIEAVQSKESSKSSVDFFKALEGQLSQYMGPVTSIIIQDCVAEMGCGESDFPMAKAYELVNQLSPSITNRVEAESFVRSMNDWLDQD